MRIIGEPPNVENTVPLHLFRAQSPARYSHLDGDKAVLYAGANNLAVSLNQERGAGGRDGESGSGNEGDSLKGGEVVSSLSQHPVTMYVLNSSLVLWIPALDTGLDISYTLVVLHAVKEQSGREVLYLQMLSGAQTTELVFATGGCSQGEELFSTSASVPELYDALSACLAFHYDTDDSDASVQEWFTADSLPAEPVAVPAAWLNSGDADDLGMELSDDLDLQAGMDVALHHRPVAGYSRKSAVLGEKEKKRRIE